MENLSSTSVVYFGITLASMPSFSNGKRRGALTTTPSRKQHLRLRKKALKRLLQRQVYVDPILGLIAIVV